MSEISDFVDLHCSSLVILHVGCYNLYHCRDVQSRGKNAS